MGEKARRDSSGCGGGRRLFTPPLCAGIVYLSPDAEEVLEAPLEAEKTYVIGGLVDGTVVKHASLRRAAALGVAAARIPLAEHAALGRSSQPVDRAGVLTLPAAVDVLLRVHAGASWSQAMRAALPPRFFLSAEEEAEARAKRQRAKEQSRRTT